MSRRSRSSSSLSLTRATGTFRVAAWHLVGIAAWILLNVRGPRSWRFDPYPFGLLTLIVSMDGVILAIFVLIRQNRMSEQTDRRDHLDLQIDLLAEQEMTTVLRMLNRISEHLGVWPTMPNAIRRESSWKKRTSIS